MNDNDTQEAMLDPQPGDLFTEMLSVWVHVIERDGDMLKTLIAHGGNNVPPDGKVAKVPLHIFQERFQYSTTNTKYWVSLHSRENDFTALKECFDTLQPDDEYEKYIHPIRKTHPFVERTVNQILKSDEMKVIITEMVVQSLLKIKLKSV